MRLRLIISILTVITLISCDRDDILTGKVTFYTNAQAV